MTAAPSEEKYREVTGHPEVKMTELKLAQGAKPGKGGLLPGSKVTPEIADVRGIPEGEDSVSPNRHPEIDSVDDLLDFIVRLRELSGKPVGIKTVVSSKRWLDEFCKGINARGPESAPDFITVDGGDGGTGGEGHSSRRLDLPEKKKFRPPPFGTVLARK